MVLQIHINQIYVIISLASLFCYKKLLITVSNISNSSSQ